ncbi:uncharacterized protein LOC110432570 isoform X2 [Sorghum bicolor]|uniref:uncharacterized protein LOC110432570 isoform X2 n=1 Tax=Sorghum bicolor TaxID=4558 RepID=UPI000B423C17|nr:uncharacterized protein LOC110432570 isoform X2 [Sorghum bicolor]|eukprot:XP_021308976.1 uncharacterized protein LOC110432570 isoform X2 [Sorghum bicolor]
MCQFRISLMRVKLADISNFGTTLWKLIKDFNVTDLNNIHYPNCKLVHSSGKATKISTLSMTFLFDCPLCGCCTATDCPRCNLGN